MMRFDIVAVGCSWGGFESLSPLLNELPWDFGAAVVVVQHRHAGSRGELVAGLQRRSAMPVREAHDKEPIVPGTLFVAPADYHLLVEPGSFALSTDRPVQFARPSIDVLFESLADSYGPRAIGVVLSGTNEDGAAGLATLKRRGGVAIVQDPATAVRSEMPKAALDAAPVDHVLALDEIGPWLCKLCHRSTGCAP